MKPLSLHMINFMNHRDSEIDFSLFSAAIIVGKTKKNDRISNGTGKSTICHAIEYVLFNKVHRINLDKIVRDGTKKCVVEFCFESGGRKFKIHRARSSGGSSSVYLYENINDVWVPISQRTPTETEKELQAIIRINHKAFQYSVLFRQSDLSGLTEESDGSEADPKVRKDILKEPMNLMRYSKKEEIAKELMKPFKKDLAAKQASLAILGDPSSEIKESKTALSIVKTQIIENEKNSKITKETVEGKKSLLVELRTASTDDLSLSLKIAEQERNAKSLEASIAKLTNVIKSKKEDISKCSNAIESTSKSLELQIEKLSELKNRRVKDTSAINVEMSKALSAITKGTQLVAKTENEIENAKNNIPSSDVCPLCKQDISNDYRCEMEKSSQDIIDSKKKDIQHFKTILEKAEADRKRLDKEIQDSKLYGVELSSVNTLISTYNSQIAANKNSHERLGKELVDNEVDLQKNLSEYEDTVESVKSLKSSLGDKNLDAIKQQIQSLQSEVQSLDEKAKTIQNDFTNLKIKESALEQKIKTKTEDEIKVSQINDQMAVLRKEILRHQIVVDSYSHKGIPTFIINTCLNDLLLETNAALQELRPDLHVTFDADLNFKYKRNGVDREYHQLSRGQHVYIALSLKRGLSRVIQRKLGVDLRLMMFDEVDSPLDEEGVEAFANAVKKWKNEFSILIITHNRTLKDSFPHAILVEEGDDGAEARVVTSW